MVINLEQKKIHFDLRFILTYNIYTLLCLLSFTSNYKYN